MKFKRDIFTNELVETEFETDGRRTIIASAGPSGPVSKTGGAWQRPWRGKALAVNPVQAEAFTRAARADGNYGVHYCPRTGELVAEDRVSRAKEVARRGKPDYSGGYVEDSYYARRRTG